MKKSKKTESETKMLTDVELELMAILWKLKEGSVADVMAGLSPHRGLAYTSVSTILRILQQKGVLAIRKEGRGHIYIPVLQKSDYEATTVKHVVERVFEGTPMALVRQLLSTADLDQAALEELKCLIEEKAGEKR